MRKHHFSSVITIFAVITLLITGCSTNAKAATDETDWKYYDEFVEYMSANPADTTKDDAAAYTNVSDPTDEMLERVEDARNAVRTSLGQYEDLDWSHFEDVEFVACDITNMHGAAAFYSVEDDRIYLDREYMRRYGNKTAENNIAHELIHVLALPGNRTNIDEALTAYLANEAVPSDLITYPFSYIFIQKYLKTHDAKGAIDAMRNGTLAELVEKDIGRPGVLSGESDMLFEAVNSGMINDANLYIVIDIYAHYVRNTGGLDEESANALNRMLGYLNDTPESRKAVEYFGEILNS